MTPDDFIAEVERRQLLSGRLVAKLRELLAGYTEPYTADEVADFLIEKNHLTLDQANSILEGGASSGVNLFQANAADLDDPFASGSNFAPPPPVAPVQTSSHDLLPADDEDYTLAPFEDSSAADTIGGEEDLPVLRVVQPDESALSGWTSSATAPIPDTEDVLEPTTVVEQRPLTDELVTPPAGPPARRATSLTRGGKKKRDKDKDDKAKSRPSKSKKSWDSPLILFGGGGLALLLLVGVTIWWLLNRETGDNVLAQAVAARDAGAYPQAIDNYEAFLKDFPSHPDHSLGRVQLAMVRIRQQTEAGDFANAANTAETELKEVEDEDAFKDAHGEIAALLPQIAIGAAAAAEKSDPTSGDATNLTDVTNKAVALYNNPAYVPKSQRDEAKLANIQDTLDRVARKQRTHVALAEGLKAMREAAAANKPVDAYAAHMKLLREHPELIG